MPDPTRSTRDAQPRGGSLVAFPGVREPRRLPDNLPLELTSFVGREREITEVKKLLADHRLVTLTGPGGCGKTRLALAVAADLVEGFEDGVCWVELGSLSDPTLVPQAVAEALSVRGQPGWSLTATLADSLRPKKVLLVLDNCEHLISACAELADTLLRACPSLRVLATSREALGIAGEVGWLVPSLSLPDPHRLPPVGELPRYEAVRLFVDRAAAVSTFALTEQNALAVARLCQELEGIPLAIELAAARAKALSVGQIAERLDDSLRLLTTGGRTALPRQQALRTTIDWSHDLLPEEERALFRRLSVFAGGFTLEATEETCAGEGIEKEEILDLLSRLVDKSLVLVAEQDDEARYRLLETVRQYGEEKLNESGEAATIKRRHAGSFLELAEQAEPRLKGRQQVEWLERLEREHDNLRAAIAWLLEEGQIETVVRLAWALWFFWYLRGHQGEGYRYTGEALEKGDDLPTGVRAKALCVRGIMSYGLESFEWTMRLFEESAALFRQVGDKPGLALALGGAGVGTLLQGDMERASMLLEEGLKLYREVGDNWGVSETLGYLGMIPLNRGDHAQATRHFEEALSLSREIGNRHSGYVSLYNLALIARAQGDHERAVRLYVEGLRLVVEIGDKADIAYCIEGLAELVGARGEPERAARLFGASEALLEAVGAPLYVQVQDRASIERAVDDLRSRLDETTFRAAWAQGRAMTLEGAVEYALGETPPPPTAEEPAPALVVESPCKPGARPEPLRIFALGPTRVERGDRALAPSDWGHAKPRELLFYLLGHPSRSREQIGLALWPEASPQRLRKTFHVTLHRLRRALGGQRWVLFEGGRYAFDRSLPYWYDAEAFESELGRGLREEAPARAMEHLRRAAELYGGDFLEDFAEAGWASVRREELQQAYLEGLLSLGGLLLEEGRHNEAAEAYREALAREELLEAAHRGLMRCHAALGERGRALRHYQGLVELLREELGTLPAPETAELHQRLLRDEDV